MGNAHPTKPPRRRGLIAMVAAAAAAALLLGIVIVIKDREGRVVAEVETNNPATIKTSAGATAEVRATVENAPRAAAPADAAGAADDAVPDDNPAPAAPPTRRAQRMAARSANLHRADVAPIKDLPAAPLSPKTQDLRPRRRRRGALVEQRNGELARIFVGADSPSGGIAWSPDGAAIAVAAGTKILAWQPATGKNVCTIALQDGEAASLAWSPDGKTFAVGQRPLDQPEAPARQLCLYDIATGKLISDRHRDDWSVEQIAWSPDSKRLLIDDPGQLMQSFDRLATSKDTHKWEVQPRYAISRDGRRVARHGRHFGGPELVNMDTGDALWRHVRTTGEHYVNFIGTWLDDDTLAFVTAADRACLLDTHAMFPHAISAAQRGLISDLRRSADGRRFTMVNYRSGDVRQYSSETAEIVQVGAATPDMPRLSPDGELIAARLESGRVRILDTSRRQPPRTLDATTDTPVTWSRNNKRIAGGGRRWDAETGEVIARLPRAGLAGETGAPRLVA